MGSVRKVSKEGSKVGDVTEDGEIVRGVMDMDADKTPARVNIKDSVVEGNLKTPCMHNLIYTGNSSLQSPINLTPGWYKLADTIERLSNEKRNVDVNSGQYKSIDRDSDVAGAVLFGHGVTGNSNQNSREGNKN